MSRFSLAMLALGFWVISVPGVSQGAANVLFILDGSGSMQGQVEGKPKIDIAKQVLATLLRDLPKDTKVGLMAYGHRSEKDCKDVEVLAPVGEHDLNRLVKRLQAIRPKGKTPLAYSLEQSLPVLAAFSGQNNAIVLVSDGIETCGGDPCKTAEKLAVANIGLKVHVVGFDVGAAERQQLECIAKGGKGKYFPAKDTSGLKQAFAQVKQEVIQAPAKPAAPPTPAPPRFKEYFSDQFEGNTLKDHWEVLNPNPGNFMVEKGNLLVISQLPGKISEENVANTFRLKKPLPPGDWMISAQMRVDFQTGAEIAFLGLYEDKSNYIIVQIKPGAYWAGRGAWTPPAVEIVKCARGVVSTFARAIGGETIEKSGKLTYSDAMKLVAQPLMLRLRKEGRSYYGAAMLVGAEKPQWVEVEKVTALQAMGMPILGVYQEQKVSGESLVHFDWVKIETPE